MRPGPTHPPTSIINSDLWNFLLCKAHWLPSLLSSDCMSVACRLARYCSPRSSVTSQSRRFGVEPTSRPDTPVMLKRLDKPDMQFSASCFNYSPERGSSAVECRTLNRGSSSLSPSCYHFEARAFSFSP